MNDIRMTQNRNAFARKDLQPSATLYARTVTYTPKLTEQEVARATQLERLYWAAGHHTRSANQKQASDDKDVRMDAAVHIGAAVELMAKAVLVSVEPRLILGEHSTHDVLVDMLAENGSAVAHSLKKGKSPAKTTVAARKAVDLAARLVPVMRTHRTGAGEALAIRNHAAHAAELDDAKLPAHIAAGTAFIMAGVYYLSRDAEAFLGRELSQQVEQNTDDIATALRSNAEMKVAAARHKYQTLIEPLPSKARASVLSALQERFADAGDVQEPSTCPACENEGAAVSVVDFDVELDGPDEWREVPFLTFMGFECPYCGLFLDAMDCDAIGLDPRGGPAEMFDIQD